MPSRSLPVRPNLDQLKHQAKDLLRAYRAGTADAAAIVHAVVSLGRGLGMKVTAEGVETAEDFERMRDLGCDVIQGYLFGKPLPYDRANQMVVGLGAKRLAG